MQELASTKDGYGHLFYQWDDLLFESGELDAISTIFAGALTGKAYEKFILKFSRNLGNAFSVTSQLRMLHQMRSTRDASVDAGMEFLEYADLLWKFHCSDPRDRLYALIGLYPELDFKADYSKAVEEVYVSFATHLISTRPQCLPTLLNCAVNFPRQNRFWPHWPSWVPDWRHRMQPFKEWDPTERVSLSGPLVPGGLVDITALDKHDPSRLRVAGFYVGYIIGARTEVTHPAGPAYYLMVTAKGYLACIFPDSISFYPEKGDLVFDLGKLHIIRPLSSIDRLGVLEAVTHADKLYISQTFADDSNDASLHADDGLVAATSIAGKDQVDFTTICNKAYGGMAQLLQPDDLYRKAARLKQLLSSRRGRKYFYNGPEPRVRGQETIFLLA